MAAILSFEQAPPISVPFRFFLTAPLYGVAAGWLLFVGGGDLLVSRWLPANLALTHLLTLGFLLQVMCGALMQVLPVVAGANIWRPRTLAWVSHVGINLGCLVLVAGFLSGQPQCFRWALPLLAGSVALFALAVTVSLYRTPAKGPTVTTIKLAVASLVVTVFLGGLLASVFGWGMGLPVMELVALHAGWGLFGWCLLLVVGVAYQVVPMFQLTPAYGRRLAQALPWSIFALLVAWSTLTEVASPELIRQTGLLGLYAAAAVFALATLYLQDKRRRKVGDPSLRFWRVGMSSLLLAAALGMMAILAPVAELSERIELAQGMLALVGVLMSLLCGMLYKIVPFLNWLHLQKVISPVPNLRHMLAEKTMLGQLRVHIAALVLLLMAIAVPALASLAGLALVVDCLWLEWNLVSAAQLYLRLKKGKTALPLATPG